MGKGKVKGDSGDTNESKCLWREDTICEARGRPTQLPNELIFPEHLLFARHSGQCWEYNGAKPVPVPAVRNAFSNLGWSC